MNSFINLLHAGYFQTPCPLSIRLLLLPQHSNTMKTFCPLSSSFSPTQQHHEEILPFVFFFFPNTATSRRCNPLSSSPTPGRRSLSLSDYWTMICYLPTRHRTKDEDSRLWQWWIHYKEKDIWCHL